MTTVATTTMAAISSSLSESASGPIYTTTVTTAATTIIYITAPAASNPNPSFSLSSIYDPTSKYTNSFNVPMSTASTIPTMIPSITIHTGGISHPNEEQIKTIWIAAVMLISILVGWNLCLFRTILYPWKMLINLIHESGHVFVGILTCANVYSITIDPEKGPISGMTGGQPHLILSAGYTTSILTGSAMIMSAFDISASKITSLCLFPLFLVCFWFGRTWARIRLLGCIGLSIGFWFIDRAAYLRYYILFIGVMCAFYALWDALDDFLFRKENESDAALFARLSGPTNQAWMVIWLIITIVFVSLGVLGGESGENGVVARNTVPLYLKSTPSKPGLYFFDKSAEAQLQAQQIFLPT